MGQKELKRKKSSGNAGSKDRKSKKGNSGKKGTLADMNKSDADSNCDREK